MRPEKMKFTPEQERSINSPEGEFVVKAGAGTGKTRVLVHKYIAIFEKLRDEGERPERAVSRILTLTFTRRAAREMLSRLQELIPRPALAEARISTIDAFCAGYLRENAFEANLDPSFKVIDGVEAKLLFRKIGREVLDKPSSPVLESESPLDSFLSDAFSLVNRLKQNLIGVQEFKKKAGNTSDGEAISMLYSAYEEYLGSENLMDFGRLLCTLYSYLKKDEKALEKIRGEHTHLLVDEYQDTNPAQVKLLRLIAAPRNNYFAVGDEQQSIYGFRGAEPKSIMEFFAKSPPERKATLNLNFRTPPPITDLVNSVFKDKMDGYFPLRSGAEGRSEAEIFLAASRSEEARFTARKAREFIDKGYDPSDIVVLMRGVKNASDFEEALREEGIPSVTVGGLGFYGQPEIKDILSMLIAADNPYNDRELLRVLRSPAFGIPDSVLSSLLASNKSKGSLYLRLSEKKDGRIREAMGFLESIRSMKYKSTLLGLINFIIEESGLLLRAMTSPGGRRSREASNIQKFISIARGFEAKNVFTSTADFALYLRELELAGVDEPEARPKVQGLIHIMSIHQSKGLEFPVVFLSNITPVNFPSRALMDKYHFNKADGLIIKDDSKDSFYSKYMKDALYLRHHQEERRLLYVGMTRSMKHLILTGSRGAKDKASQYMEYFLDTSSEEVRVKEELKSMIKTAGLPDESGRKKKVSQLKDSDKEIPRILQEASGRLGIPRFIRKPQRIEVSVTALETYSRCPLLYKFRYINRVPLRPPEEGFSASLFGSAVHRLLEEYYREDRAPAKNPEERLCSLILSGGVTSSEYRKYYLKRVRMAILGIKTPGLLKDKRSILATEQPFTLKYLGAYIKGTIDRVDSEPYPSIIDYKTSLKLKPGRYSLQLNIYRLAVENLFNLDNPRLYISHVFSGKSALLPADVFINIRLRSILNGITSCIFYPNPGEYCRYCPYISICAKQNIC